MGVVLTSEDSLAPRRELTLLLDNRSWLIVDMLGEGTAQLQISDARFKQSKFLETVYANLSGPLRQRSRRTVGSNKVGCLAVSPAFSRMGMT